MLDDLLPGLAKPPAAPPLRTAQTADPRPETVTELSRRIRMQLETGFRAVWVEGEVSNLRLSANSPHAYFSLKDNDAQIACTLFRAASRPADLQHLKNGNKIRIQGSLTVYIPRGSYQIAVSRIDPVGLGELLLRLEELRKRLAAEGLFDPAVKRPIPFLPKRVGIVTSPTGAAIQDMLRISREQNPGIDILLAPAVVQGLQAGPSIAEGIRQLNALPAERRPDVLIVGRGGGSIEDLWCFNDECVVRAIRASAIPVVSAVGHEIDHTLCDDAADLSVATPSHAAKAVFRPRTELLAGVETLRHRLSLSVTRALDAARRRLAAAADSRAFARPETVLAEHAHTVTLLEQRMDTVLRNALTAHRLRIASAPARLTAALQNAAARRRLQLSTLAPRPAAALTERTAAARRRLETLAAKLSALDPTAVLQRGYALVRNDEGVIVTRAAQLHAGDGFSARFRDGSVHAVVREDASPAPAVGEEPPKPRRPRKQPPRPQPQPDGPVQATLF